MSIQKPKMILLAMLGLAFFTMAGRAQAATYYISPSGNDSTGNGSIGAPWKTVNKANSVISAGTSRSSMGDTVIIRGGTYTGSGIISTITKAYTTWQAYPGETPLFDGQFTVPVPDGNHTPIFMISADGVVLDGVHIYRSGSRGITIWKENGSLSNGRVTTTMSGVIIRNVKVDWTMRESIVPYFVSDVLIEDSEFSRGVKSVEQFCNYNLVYCRTTIWTDGAMIPVPSCNNVTFRRCIIRDSYNEGINLERYSTGLTLEYSQIYGNRKYQVYVVSGHDAVVRYNTIYGVATNANGNSADEGSGIWLSAETGWTNTNNYGGHKVYGNFIVNCASSFWLDAQTSESFNPKVNNCLIYNNTFLYPTDTWNIGISASAGTGNVFRNNMVVGAGSYGIAYVIAGHATFGYNLWSVPQGNVYDAAEGAGDTYGSVPAMAKISGWNSISAGTLSPNDFKLQSADNGGVTLGSPYNSDYWGTVRPQGTAYDRGAHEYTTGSGDTTPPSAPSGLSVR